ncbi:hypothetical protein DB35_25945 [Streptomyces abyssalis]|uniref:Uncharacterized protein n=1 Tax=Streptomyces abyssalis TaxID=933944 RepID=A0A1E7JMY1_9ACTN|nr:DsrE family protein [Streptomyces abyssalis]OEU87010.1 hypothetical protein DB35_25945 [Streptomyces abyssalis]OEU89605.1 hypothetical protein AN215_07620 [Streptomyces abyssalis]OEV21086.1 hypothetical protein AN219_27305 [Streptomyces nanshensis]
MAQKITPTDVMLAVYGSPHQTELITTALRLTQALLDRGARVQIWTCGDATGLTRSTLGRTKPRNVLRWTTDYPSSASVISDLLDEYPDLLHWYVCRFCSDERGMSEQIPQVRRRPPFTFWDHTKSAGKLLTLGVC